jgi:chromate transporter
MATFAGYLAYGFAGALVATFFVFLPALLLVVIPGPLIRRHEAHPRLQGFIKGATAAAAGAIAGAAIVIGQDVIQDGWSVAIAVVALGLLLQPWRRVSEPALVALAAAVGLLAFG